jgi:hypothetical protein
MRVDIANTGAAQVSVLYQREHLHRTRNHGLREAVETREKKFEILHLAQRNFADHKRMDQHHLAFEMPHEVVIGAPDMIDPNGAIDQQHQSFVAPARRALDEALLDQIGLDDLLDRVARLGQRGRDRLDADRAAAVILGDAS